MNQFKSALRTTAHICGYIAVMLATQWVVSHFTSHSETGLILANTFATPNMVLRKVARRLVNNCVFAHRENVMRDYDDEYRQRGVKMGDTVNLRLPQRYEPTIGAVMNPTPLTDQTVSLAITDQTNIGFEYDSWAATLEVDDYMERYADPAVDTLVNNIDYTGLTRMYKAVAKCTGTPGTVPTTATPYSLAKTKLVEAAVPRPFRAMLTSDAHAQISEAYAGLFNPSAQIAMNFRTGQFNGAAFGISRWYEDENIATHRVGALGGTPVVAGAGQSGSSVNVSGLTGSVVGYWNEGDNIQFASAQEINPQNHQSTNRNKDYVITARVDSAVGGTATIQVSPEIIASGPFATVDELPANGDAITTFGHASAYANAVTRQGLVYHKEAFALVMADLVLPRGLWVSERISNAKLGVSVRMLKDHDVVNDISPARLDTAHGWGAIRQELACRVNM